MPSIKTFKLQKKQKQTNKKTSKQNFSDSPVMHISLSECAWRPTGNLYWLPAELKMSGSNY
jgi:hypothetical protein